MSHQDTSVKSILFALLANLGIAITKTFAAVITGSGAMLAESIHSYADCGNQGLLFFGLKAARKSPTMNIRWDMGKRSISGRLLLPLSYSAWVDCSRSMRASIRSVHMKD